MSSMALFSEVAALAGDPARASMLHALMDGRALTASELAAAAGITPQTASGHLSRMVAAGVVAVEKQGRHRYHRLARASVAHMLEGIMQVAAEIETRGKLPRIGPKDAALREARTCYDHMAGRLGVALTDALLDAGHVELTQDAGVVTESGLDLLGRVGLDTAGLRARRTRASGRVLCRPCLDWSERRPHLGGALGAALCDHCMREHWVKRINGTRALEITRKGERMFRETFGLRLR